VSVIDEHRLATLHYGNGLAGFDRCQIDVAGTLKHVVSGIHAVDLRSDYGKGARGQVQEAIVSATALPLISTRAATDLMDRDAARNTLLRRALPAPPSDAFCQLG